MLKPDEAADKNDNSAAAGSPELSRRRFIRTAGAAVGSAMAASPARAQIPRAVFPASVLGANERILTGHIGLGGMGKRDLQFVMLRDDMQPIMMCDLLEEHREQGADIAEGKFQRPPTTPYFEKIIENKDVDAVVVCTPDHWHTLPALMACESGKDVYCEKPLATTIAEGRALVEAVHRNGTVFQMGTMQRSGPYFQEAVDLIRSGHIGTIARVETWAHDARPVAGLGNPPDGTPPDGLDWDRYIGWTPKVPYNENRFLYNFRWFLDYSGGKVTDWGTHLLDIALWAMGEEKKPRAVTAMGGKYIVEDNTTVPDTLEVLWEFDDYVLSFSDRMYNPMPEGRGLHYGILFHGTLGTMRVDRKGYEIFSFKHNGGCERKVVKDAKEMPMNTGHWENFASCVRSRKPPICNVDVGHNTTTVCHMGTSAYVAGGRLEWDAERERFTGKDKRAVKTANDWAYREYANGWSLKSPYYKGWSI